MLSGVVLVWRTVHGPFQLGSVPVTSPLNAQSVFGLSATILLIGTRRRAASTQAHARYEILWLSAILLLTLATLWPAVGLPLVFDDYTLAEEGHVVTPATVAYHFTHAGGDGFFRPVGYLSLGLDARWAGRDPFRWHIVGLLLHLANIVLVWRLAGCLAGDCVAALWATTLFAIHGTVLLTPMYLAARFDVLAVFFVLAGLISFQQYLRTNRLSLLALGVASSVLGMLTKETAFVFPLLAILVSGSKVRSHAQAIAGFFGAAALVFIYRYSLLGGLGGYRDPVTGSPQVLDASLLGYLKGFALRIWSAFYFPMNWSHEPEPWLVGLLLAYLAALVWICVCTSASRGRLLAMLAFIVVALLPLAHLLLVDASLLGAGRFYLALVGSAMMLGITLRDTPRPGQLLAGLILVLFQVGALRHNLAIWSATSRLVEQTCVAAGEISGNGRALVVAGLPREIDGVPFLGTNNGFGACVRFYGRAVPITSRAPALRWDSRTRSLVPQD